MKQLSLNELTGALVDTPKTIAERLEILGFAREDLAGKFPEDVLDLSVYGSSFLKFLQDNATKLEVEESVAPEALPEDFKNAFADETMTIGERLRALDIEENDIHDMFSPEALNVEVSGDEFQDFIVQNQDKFLDKLDKLSGLENQSDDGTPSNGAEGES